MYQCSEGAARRTVTSPLVVDDFTRFGQVDVMPMAVDTDLMRPRDKAEMRACYGIDEKALVGFWSGTMHPMKGYDVLCEYADQNPAIRWLICWKTGSDAHRGRKRRDLPGWHFIRVPQTTIAELMAAADFLACPGRLRPFFLVEWEAMACDLPVRIIGNPEKDFVPSDHPRQDIIDRGWSRNDAKAQWLEYIGSV
jgi:hypothetical protein